MDFGGRTNDGFADADSAGDLDQRRSTTGYVFILNGGAISWASKKQKLTTLSYTDSELVAACDTTKEAVWLKRLLSELGDQF